MRIAFRTGGVAGMFTVGLGLFGAAIVVLIYKGNAPDVLEGFGFGAALLAMFMRVGGGIYTKAADVGADLVGKVEQGIPEDDPRNAATIADNVGDNVGDCAGMAADLFESYAVMLVASLILGKVAFGDKGLIFPLIVPMIGVITAVIGIFAVAPRARDRSGMTAINRGFFISAAISVIGVAILCFTFLPSKFSSLVGHHRPRDRELQRQPAVDRVRRGADRDRAGVRDPAADRVLHRDHPAAGQGHRAELGDRRGHRDPVRHLERHGVRRVLGAADRRGRVRLLPAGHRQRHYRAVRRGHGRRRPADHGRRDRVDGLLRPGDRQRAGHRGDVRRRRGRGRAGADPPGRDRQHHQGDHQGHRDRDRGAGGDRAVRLVPHSGRASLGSAAGTFSLSVDKPNVLVGLIIGASVVFLFSSLLIMAVGRAAQRVVLEVRMQFRTHPGIMTYEEKPDYSRVVDIVTADSLRELVTPGILAVLTPIAVGFAFGYAPLGSFLAGAIAAGVLMAVFLSNSGGAWDNAKKLVEDGNHGGKGSAAHEATIVGDTVGDPFKDTAGPAINPLLKVMNLVSLLIATSVVKYSSNTGLRVGVALGAVIIIVAAIVYSKRRSAGMGEEAPASAEISAATSPAVSASSPEAVRAPHRGDASGLRDAAGPPGRRSGPERPRNQRLAHGGRLVAGPACRVTRPDERCGLRTRTWCGGRSVALRPGSDRRGVPRSPGR